MSQARQYEMKDSGVEWIGRIPRHWELSKMKRILCNASIKGHPEAQVLSLYREYGVIPKDSRDDNHNVTSEDTASYKYVEIGDLVINKMKAWQGSLGLSQYEGIVSPAYYVCKFISNSISRKYLHHLIRSRAYAQEFERLSTGMRVGQWDLGIDDFLRVPLLCPPLPEQAAIAAYLDDKCAAIDGVIAEAKSSIDDYKAWKASIISEVVTKGLDTNAVMKDSGADWVGVIPRGWTVERLKALFAFGKGLPITKEDLVECGIPVISYGQIHAKCNTGVEVLPELLRYVDAKWLDSNAGSLVGEGDFIFADTSEDMDGCGNCVYIDSLDEGARLFAGYHTITFRPKKTKRNKYLAYLFKSDAWRTQLRSRVSGVKLFSISRRMLNSATVILPPAEEQAAIVSYLDDKCAVIDSIIAEKEALIAELETYKKSLIFETVTGKRRVC